MLKQIDPLCQRQKPRQHGAKGQALARQPLGGQDVVCVKQQMPVPLGRGLGFMGNARARNEILGGDQHAAGPGQGVLYQQTVLSRHP